ncbi:HNH endonuclease signature motif containing protein [Photobacterium rosenbergii]|uniref:HNH endonuclease signature motif containing protein n=1 Tax=Photobacterium rosenbergii TaxID=294936 RepID=UPI001C9A1F6E|nr:HNH endonuclease signature motif containing protein [Photobacterium rosenbergii]MBY5946832.1 HNH endonuclease [Photobacterium rosenbergii]
MKLTFDLSALNNAIQQMQPKKKGRFTLEYTPSNIDPIDIELGEGKEVELKDVDADTGLLSYKGRQVLLYIRDVGTSVVAALNSPEKSGPKYHVADCAKLKGMRTQGLFERYVVTNDVSGEFLLTGSHYIDGRDIEGKARLNVCKSCIRALNYQGYATGDKFKKEEVFERFDMSRFFATYSSFFPHMPQRKADDLRKDYTDDWGRIEAKYKVAMKYCCEQCDVDLSKHKIHYHVHHKNGIKHDNSQSNLIGLCSDCMSKQKNVKGFYIMHDVRQLIAGLRREQTITDDLADWEEIFELTDPAVHGALHYCQKDRTRLPEPGYDIQNKSQEIVGLLELAWPHLKFGVGVSSADLTSANEIGWSAVGVQEFIANAKKYTQMLR